MSLTEKLDVLFNRRERYVGTLDKFHRLDILEDSHPGYSEDDLRDLPVSNVVTLAAATGLSEKTIGNAKRGMMSMATASRIAHLFGITPEFLSERASVDDLKAHLDEEDAKDRPVTNWTAVASTTDPRLVAEAAVDTRPDSSNAPLAMFGHDAKQPIGRGGVPELPLSKPPCVRLTVNRDYCITKLDDHRVGPWFIVILQDPRGDYLIGNRVTRIDAEHGRIEPYALLGGSGTLPSQGQRWFWHEGDEEVGGKWTFTVLLSTAPFELSMLAVAGSAADDGRISLAELNRLAGWAAARREDSVLFAQTACIVVND